MMTMQVPRAAQRLAAMSCCLSSQETVQSIQNSAEAILRAVTEVNEPHTLNNISTWSFMVLHNVHVCLRLNGSRFVKNDARGLRSVSLSTIF